MAFYVIEKTDQLEKLTHFGDCFIDFISQNNNFHSKISPLSLIYLRPLNDHKGYIFCLNHSESFSLDKEHIINWINNNTQKLFTPDKKRALYYFDNFNKLYDINFIENIPLDKLQTNNCIDFYYRKHHALPNVNCLIPLSKHYEEKENLFGLLKPIISQFKENDDIYNFNNNQTTKVFFEIENNGIKIDKECFIDCYSNDLKHPEFNILKGKIYSHYNLYTTTSRPSNSYNHINFVALNKNNGERLCYRPANDMFIEFDIQGYHPRLLGEMIDFSFLNTRNTYETLATILDVSPEEAKELTFKQIYGGVWKEYQNKPFFKDIVKLTDNIWDEYQFARYYDTQNRKFINDGSDMTQSKLLNYIIQSKETSTNVKILKDIVDYLQDKQTKLVLYTYDAFLFDFAKSDGKDTLIKLQQIITYPTNIKKGKTYHNLQKI
jgi:hypothetical protein